MAMNEQDSADLAKRRGQAAAHISDPNKRREFIAAQGNYEANKDQSPLSKVTSLMTPSKLESETQAVTASKGMKGIDSYKKGGIVKKTGPAFMHKGEIVIPNDMGLAEGPMAHGAEKEKPKSKKEVKSVHVRKAKKGGYIAENHHVSPDHPMEEHALPDMAALQEHMQESLGSGEEGGAEQQSGVPSEEQGE
jgi:hypothetical protein